MKFGKGIATAIFMGLFSSALMAKTHNRCIEIVNGLRTGYLKERSQIKINYSGPKINQLNLRTTQAPHSPFVYVVNGFDSRYQVFQPNEELYGFNRPTVHQFDLVKNFEGVLESLHFDGRSDNLLGVFSSGKTVLLWNLFLNNGENGKLAAEFNHAPVKLPFAKNGKNVRVAALVGTQKYFIVAGTRDYAMVERTDEKGLEVKKIKSLKFDSEGEQISFDEIGFFANGKSGYVSFHNKEGKSGIVPMRVDENDELQFDFEKAQFLIDAGEKPKFISGSPYLPLIYVAYQNYYLAVILGSEGFVAIDSFPIPANANLNAIDFYSYRQPVGEGEFKPVARPFFILEDRTSSQIIYGENGF